MTAEAAPHGRNTGSNGMQVTAAGLAGIADTSRRHVDGVAMTAEALAGGADDHSTSRGHVNGVAITAEALARGSLEEPASTSRSGEGNTKLSFENLEKAAIKLENTTHEGFDKIAKQERLAQYQERLAQYKEAFGVGADGSSPNGVTVAGMEKLPEGITTAQVIADFKDPFFQQNMKIMNQSAGAMENLADSAKALENGIAAQQASTKFDLGKSSVADTVGSLINNLTDKFVQKYKEPEPEGQNTSRGHGSNGQPLTAEGLAGGDPSRPPDCRPAAGQAAAACR